MDDDKPSYQARITSIDADIAAIKSKIFEQRKRLSQSEGSLRHLREHVLGSYLVNLDALQYMRHIVMTLRADAAYIRIAKRTLCDHR